MANEIDHVEVENNEDIELETEVEVEKPKEKKKFTPEEQLAIHKREAKKLAKQLGLETDEPKTESKEKSKSSELDFGQLAFHNSKSDAIKIEAEADIEFLKETMEETGKSQQSILNSKWFQADLKERQDGRKSEEAVPKGTKRSGSSAKDELSVAIAKFKATGEAPTDFELRGKVFDQILKQEGSNAQFYNSK